MESNNSKYVKRTQKDYSTSFKLQLVAEYEQGFLSKTQLQKKYGIQSISTISRWIQKFGTFSNGFKVTSKIMKKTPEQRILELEQQVKLLEKQKSEAEFLANQTQKKVILFDMMIDIAEEEFKIPIRKKPNPELLKNLRKYNKKQ